MPPPDDVIDNISLVLGTIRLKSFTAEPNSVRPLNDVTLAWEATEPTGPSANSVVFTLGGVRVANSGSRTVRPVRSKSFSLFAEAFTLRKQLGTVMVNVDLSGCLVNSFPERELRTLFLNKLQETFPEDEGAKIELAGLPDLTVKVNNDRTQLRLDTGGVSVSSEFEVEINNLPDGTLKFDALIGLGAENGKLVHKILKFSTDFDFSVVIDIISHGLTELLEAITDFANDRVRNAVDEGLSDMFSNVGNQIPSNFALLTVSPATRRLDFTICPT